MPARLLRRRASAPRSSRCRARWTGCARWPTPPAPPSASLTRGTPAPACARRRARGLGCRVAARAADPATPTAPRCRGQTGRARPRAAPARPQGRALVVLADGELVLYVERGGKTLLSWTSEPALLEPATAALAAAVRAGALGRLTVSALMAAESTTRRWPGPWRRQASGPLRGGCAFAGEQLPGATTAISAAHLIATALAGDPIPPAHSAER